MDRIGILFNLYVIMAGQAVAICDCLIAKGNGWIKNKRKKYEAYYIKPVLFIRNIYLLDETPQPSASRAEGLCLNMKINKTYSVFGAGCAILE